MRALQVPGSELRRYPLAVAAGLLVAVAFPKFHVAGLGWLGPGLMLAAAFGLHGGAAFRVGFVAGLAHFLVTLSWLLFMPVRFYPVLGWLALAAYCALYPAAWVWLCWKLYPAQESTASASGGLVPWTERLDRFLTVSRVQRLGWGLACAALWVAGEMIRARLFSGFPWAFLGVSQYRILPVIQLAAWTGVYGVSFLMVWLSVSLACAGAAMLRQPQRRQTWMAEVFLPVLVLVLVVTVGTRRLFPREEPTPFLRLALVQPSIPQTMIWDPADSAKRFEQLLALSEAALTNKPDVLVWPEAAVPGLLRWDTNRLGGATPLEAITSLARRHGVWVVIGADDAEPNKRAPGGADFFNSSFLISPRGEVVATYRKRRLVIFGEYVPLSETLPFLRQLTPIQGGFTPGKEAAPFFLSDLRVKTLVLICFEDTFPHWVQADVTDDLDFLLNITNNGWFGESAAQWQHAANAVFRAIENGLPLVRCSNNGLTCWVDAQGRLNELFVAGQENVYGAGFKVVAVPLRGDSPPVRTLYRQRGDWFGWACTGWITLVAARHGIRSRLSRRAS